MTTVMVGKRLMKKRRRRRGPTMKIPGKKVEQVRRRCGTQYFREALSSSGLLYFIRSKIVKRY